MISTTFYFISPKLREQWEIIIITSCDTETGDKVIDNGPDHCLLLQFSGKCTIQAEQGNRDQENGLRPIDVLVPVLPSRRLIKERWHLCLFKRRLSVL